MNATNRELFRAIHEGCWLYIEYHNKQEENTKYWIAVKDIDPVTKTIKADGM